MIASARAAPICGSASSSSLLALLMSISAACEGEVVDVVGPVDGELLVAGFAGAAGAAVCARVGDASRRARAVRAPKLDRRIKERSSLVGLSIRHSHV